MGPTRCKEEYCGECYCETVRLETETNKIEQLYVESALMIWVQSEIRGQIWRIRQAFRKNQ